MKRRFKLLSILLLILGLISGCGPGQDRPKASGDVSVSGQKEGSTDAPADASSGSAGDVRSDDQTDPAEADGQGS